MLDTKLLRQDLQEVCKRLKVKGHELDTTAYEKLDAERKALQTKVQSLQNERNVQSKAIGQAKAKGEDVSEILKQVSQLGDKLSELNQKLVTLQEQLDNWLMEIPNIPHDSVPKGKDESANAQIRKWGEIKIENGPDHTSLTEQGNKMDFTASAKLSGSRFVVMRGELARLHRALIQFMLDMHTKKHDYQEVYVPYLVNADSLRGTGQLPKFKQDLFEVAEQELYLIPTAEVPVTNLVRDVIIEEKELPIKWVCHTPCFRSEAGSYGQDTKGLIRQHQFEKVELVQIVKPEDSFDALEQLTNHAETVLQQLELPYRVMTLCGGDLGFSSAKTYDIEVWLPGQGRYREISSCSNMTDFQARRMKARWRNTATGKPELVHTLNGSALAIGRTLVALIENFQQANSRIAIPDALRPYMDNSDSIEL